MKRLFHIAYNFVAWLDSVYVLFAAVIGLGFGLGISLVVFQTPPQSLASAEIIQTEKGIPVDQISITDNKGQIRLQERVCVESCAVREHIASVGLGKSAAVVLESLNGDVLSTLQETHLGDELVLKGSNNGKYRYTVVETREINSDSLNVVISLQNSGVVLAGKKGLLGQKSVVVVAR